MLNVLHPILFFAAIATLSGWFYFRGQDKQRTFQKAFFGFLILSGASLFFASGQTFGMKMGDFLKELLFLGGTGMAFLLLGAKKQFYIPFLALIILALAWYYSGKAPGAGPDIKLASTGELLFELKEGHELSEVGDVFEEFGIIATRAFHPEDFNTTDLDDYYVLDVPLDKIDKLKKIKSAIKKHKATDWLEENEEINVAPVVGKVQRTINEKFGLDDPGIAQLWGFERMQVDKLYAYLDSKGLKVENKAVIAILDTGVDATHEDIKDNFKSTREKYDNDPKNHGTHCAGIAAAVSNNGVGVASFSRDNSFVNVTSIKVLGASGMGTQQGIINGILEAADKGVEVISLSLGGPSSNSKQRAYNKAMKYANEKGAIVVVAAGNSNRDAKSYAPANSEGVITVSAINENLERAPFSNYIDNLKMGVAAPGTNIYSTIPNNKYATFNGTSMATPYVSGLIGLMKSIRPELTTDQAFDILDKTGIKTKDTKKTGYFIQPYEAVKMLIEG